MNYRTIVVHLAQVEVRADTSRAPSLIQIKKYTISRKSKHSVVDAQVPQH